MKQQTREQELVTLTREEGSLSRRCRRLRKQLKDAKGDLKLVRAQRKALQGIMEQERNGPDIFPSRLTNGATGYEMPAAVEVIKELGWDKSLAEDFVEAINDGKEEKVR